MLKSISLKCAGCGSNLDISPEMETFACGYCGASQTVQRSGGTVSLKLLTSAISKVQAGTDKTAAELAIVRLKEELIEIERSFYNLKMNEDSAVSKAAGPFKWGVGMLTLLCLFGCVPGGFFAWFSVILWGGLSITILVYYIRRANAIHDLYKQDRKQILTLGNQIKKRIEANKAIVDA